MTTVTEERPEAATLFTFAELKQKAAGQWPSIFEDLAGTELGAAMGNAPEHVPCPVHGGSNGYRLFEHYPDTGRGICNTCGPQKSGFETLAFVKKWTHDESCSQVANWLRSGSAMAARKPRAPVVLRPKMDPALAYKFISEVWRGSLPLKGSAAERYLQKRGIWSQNMGQQLRSHPGLPYFQGKGSDRKTLGEFPCLLAPIRDKASKIVSIHRIFITEDGDKAPVPEPKRMMPACDDLSGTAVKLFPAGEVLGLAEGIETALAAHAVSRMPVWSCVSAVLMEQVDVPDHVKTVVIWGDLDRSMRGAQAADILATRLEKAGKRVLVYVPQGPIPEGSKGVDWLDVLLGPGLDGFPALWRKWRPEMIEA
jgi:putative DNA primase/helicase